MAVLNLGISGNRILNDGMGVSALARFDADVLARPGVRSLIVLEGINDIGFPNIPRNFGNGNGPNPFSAFNTDEVSADDIISGLRQIIERARTHGLKVYGGTLTPYEGAMYFSPQGEAKRQAVNDWIRSSGAFDGVIDFDAAVRDPQHPAKFLPAYQSGDNLHPSNAGYKVMADAIDLSMLRGKAAKKK
jgi:lysophospholipase L1-like esterase